MASCVTSSPLRAALKKAIVLWLSLFFVACGEQKTAPHFKLSGETMGTTYHITVLERDDVGTGEDALQKAVTEQLGVLNQQMSTYIEDSELSRLNRAPVGEPFELSANLFDVLMQSLEVAWLTGGAFDMTMASLVELWGFGPEGAPPESLPDDAAIERELQRTGFQHLEFDLANSTVTKTRDIRLDLSAVAKGYAVDKVAELLEYAGYRDYMVEIGGELRLSGQSPRGQPWRIAIEVPDPAGVHQVHRALSISDKAMATSGDYRNYFERDGRRFSHTIDPETGQPVRHKLASVTVIAETAANADALATALNVMGPEQGMRLARQQSLAVYMIIKAEEGFDTRHSEAFAPYLQSEDSP